jgi:XTP/dITP diphosphohydrolase
LTDRKLLLATTNPGKTQEIRILLQGLPIQIHSFIDTPPRSVFPENGKTFMENARGKGLAYSRNWDDLTLAEDSGLEIVSLKEAPGVFSARFAGPESTDEDNIDKVLSLMRDIPMAERNSRFVSCLVLARKGTVIKEISSEVQGFIANEKAGSFGFGYDPIFYFPPLGKTFAQLTPEEKNRVSHRGKALRQLQDYLQDFLKQRVYK